MQSSKERLIEQVREELEKQPAIKHLWQSQHKIVANRISALCSSGNILEIGCGSGAINDYLGSHLKYSGIDPIECKSAHFDFKKGYAESIPYPDGIFDLILIKDAVNYFRNLDPVILEAFRVLKSDGAIFITENVGDNYRPGIQKAKNLIKKHLRIRRNTWDKTYSNYYTSHDIIRAVKRLGFSPCYEYKPSELRYCLIVKRASQTQ